MNLYTFKAAPFRWVAGYAGAELAPIYFRCMECESEDLAGMIGTSPDFSGVGVKRTPDGFYKPAVYCAAHLPALAIGGGA